MTKDKAAKAPLISRLQSGALVIRKEGRDEVLAIGGVAHTHGTWATAWA